MRDLNGFCGLFEPSECVGLNRQTGMDDVAPPNGGAVNHSYRQTARRDVCRFSKNPGLKRINRMFMSVSQIPLSPKLFSILKEEFTTEYTEEHGGFYENHLYPP